MKKFAALSMIPLAVAVVAACSKGDDAEKSARSPDGPPAWAYVVNPPDFKPPPDDGSQRRVPDSTATFTLTQVRDLFMTPDWHPADHPAMPDIVARGRKPEVFACGVCHRADGPGGPENSHLAGLPKAYIVQQMADFKSGARNSSVPASLPAQLMIKLSKSVTDVEIEAAAAYFSALKPRSVVKVIETDTAPKTFVAGGFLAAADTGEKEPLGQRIIEVPEDLARFVSRDSHVRFVAYVPVGSVAKGKVLVAEGGKGKTVQCGICHGENLKGLGPIPGIAGASPSYTFRQLYDFQHGARTGPWSPLMAQALSGLSNDDLLSIAVYLGTLDR